MNWTIPLEAFAGVFLIVLGFVTTTQNLKSTMIFKVPSMIFGVLLIFVALAHWQHWPIG